MDDWTELKVILKIAHSNEQNKYGYENRAAHYVANFTQKD
jgi:hypothetical protein